MDATFHGKSNDTIDGLVRHRWPEILPIFSYPIAVVVVTGKNCSPVSLTPPVINLLPVSTTPAITENLGDTDS
jgi:hypothetical protein